MKAAPDATLADGRYRLQRRLGAGGMASVWLAVDERLDRPVAVKIVADTLAGDEEWVRRFQREARAAAALSHRGVVPVYDYGVQDGRPYLVMEYIGGGTLADRLPAGDPAPQGRRPTPESSGRRPSERPDAPDPRTVAKELLEAVEAVHTAGILHRDIKPGNILFDDRGHLRLTDFGIAQADDSTALTRTGMVIGTLRYLAPEIAAGEPASARSDLYSVGVVLRQLMRVRACRELEPLVDALTAEDPAARPASAAEALRQLGTPAAAAPVAGTTSAAAPTSARAAAPTSARAAAPTSAPATAPAGGAHATAPTRVLEAATLLNRRLGTMLQPRARPTPRSGGLSPIRAAAIAAGVIVLIVVIVVLASGGGGTSTSRVPNPAPARAPVSQQVQALDRIVQSATRH